MIIVLVICAVVLATLFATGTLSISVFSNVISTVSIIIPIVYLVVIYRSKKTEPHEKKKSSAWFRRSSVTQLPC